MPEKGDPGLDFAWGLENLKFATANVAAVVRTQIRKPLHASVVCIESYIYGTWKHKVVLTKINCCKNSKACFFAERKVMPATQLVVKVAIDGYINSSAHSAHRGISIS